MGLPFVMTIAALFRPSGPSARKHAKLLHVEGDRGQ
jgi:hypothetical protein